MKHPMSVAVVLFIVVLSVVRGEEGEQVKTPTKTFPVPTKEQSEWYERALEQDVDVRIEDFYLIKMLEVLGDEEKFTDEEAVRRVLAVKDNIKQVYFVPFAYEFNTSTYKEQRLLLRFACYYAREVCRGKQQVIEDALLTYIEYYGLYDPSIEFGPELTALEDEVVRRIELRTEKMKADK